MIDSHGTANLMIFVLAAALPLGLALRPLPDDGTRPPLVSAAHDTRAADADPRADTLPVPTDPNALRAFLAQGTYKQWPHQAAPHPSEAPHDKQAQVYLSAVLSQSVAARNPVHREGAAAVLEMFDDKGLVWGWAVAVKTRPSSNHGRGWYWYQVRSTPQSGMTDFGDHMIPDKPDAAGLGVRECVTCHVKGHDYIVTRSLD